MCFYCFFKGTNDNAKNEMTMDVQAHIDGVNIQGLIKLIRDSFVGAEMVYTKGSCIKFAMILLHQFPNGKILYDQGHAIFELHGICYDITGEVRPTSNHRDLSKNDLLYNYTLMQMRFDIFKDIMKLKEI